MIKADLHIHSKYSRDSISEPKDIVEIAIKKGLKAIAITDHNTIKGGLEAKKYTNKNLVVVVGSEIKTTEGEIIGLFLKKDIEKNLSLVETIKLIHQQKALAIIPHPWEQSRANSMKTITKDVLTLVDGIETCNYKSKNQMSLKDKGHSLEGLIKTGGSDAHCLLDIGQAGTSFEGVKIENENDLRKILCNNKSMPFLCNKSRLLSYLFCFVGRNLKRLKIQVILINKFIYLIQKLIVQMA